MKPNDGQCHLDTEGTYTHSILQDYPSVSQINQKVKENSVNLIFAITKEQLNIYEQLGKHVEGASYGMLSNDSSNVVELVQDQYNVRTNGNMKMVMQRLNFNKLFCFTENLLVH